MKGTVNAPFCDMAILLISWAVISTFCCLALLGAAARPFPSPDEQTAAGAETALRQEPELVMGHGNAVSPVAGAAFGSACRAA